MAQILIVLIHNQNSERLPSSRQVVRFLESVLKKGGHNVVLDEVWQQEEVKIQPRLKYITSFIYSAVTQVRYQALHLKQVPRRWLPYFFQALNIFKVLFLSSGDLRKWEIEKILTKKHLTAWGLGSTFDFTFVVEDDAILTPNNDGLGRQLCRKIKEAQESDSSFFVDLAGGFPIALVSPRNLDDKDGDVVSAPIFFTNTTCVYGLNKKLGNLLLGAVRVNPGLRKLAIDFLINSAFSRLDVKGNCHHFTDDTIIHGSMRGHYLSGI